MNEKRCIVRTLEMVQRKKAWSPAEKQKNERIDI